MNAILSAARWLVECCEMWARCSDDPRDTALLVKARVFVADLEVRAEQLKKGRAA